MDVKKTLEYLCDSNKNGVVLRQSFRSNEYFMKMNKRVTCLAVMLGAALGLSSCAVYDYPVYTSASVGVGGPGWSASAAWSDARYDVNGFPIFGYSYGQPVYGYTASGAAVFTFAALTSSCWVPSWGPAHWYCGHWHYPRHIHRVSCPPKHPAWHHPGRHSIAHHRPAAPSRPAVHHRPVAHHKPAVNHKPAAQHKPAVNHKPVVQHKPAVNHKPVKQPRPVVQHKPAVNSRPAVAQRPAQRPAGVQRPAVSRPAASHRPALVSRPAVNRPSGSRPGMSRPSGGGGHRNSSGGHQARRR